MIFVNISVVSDCAYMGRHITDQALLLSEGMAYWAKCAIDWLLKMSDRDEDGPRSRAWW